jgi:hypothetical protein
MINPDIGQCPSCKKFHFELTFVLGGRKDEDGTFRPTGGGFYTCAEKCGLYTRTLAGVYNFKSEACEQYGVKRAEPKTAKPPVATPPRRRRQGMYF